MSGDLRAKVEGLYTHEGSAYEEPGIEWLCVPTGLDHPPYSKDCGNDAAHYRLIDRDAVLDLIPEGAVLVTEETLAAALHDRDETIALSLGDDSLSCDHPRECHDKAAAILRHLREGT